MSDLTVTTDRNGSRTFGEHDDRWVRGGGRGSSRGRSSNRGAYRGKKYYGGSSNYSSNYNRRGNRGGGGRYFRGKPRGGGSGPDPRSRLDDDGDLVMDDDGEQTSSRRFSPYGRPSRGRSSRGRSSYRGSGNNSGAMQRLGLPVSSRDRNPDLWYKVIIPWGKNAGKDFLLKTLTSQSDRPFVPTYFHFEDNKAVFYIQDKEAAGAIRRISGRLTMPNGYKMTLLVKPSDAPSLPLGTEELEKLKVVMSGRYDIASKALNLSNLYQDKDLQEQNLYMALSRHQVMSNVLKIIKEHIPELEALDMSNNRISGLEILSGLVSSTPGITQLNLANNRINHIEETRKISGWKLTTLLLEGNVLCDKFKDRSAYVSAVRKMFPKVIKLDGQDLPPPITFDIEARTDLPKSKGSCFPDSNIQSMVVKFLRDYMAVYDSDNRQGLAPAYHDSAVFSLSVSYNGAMQFKQPSLHPYLEESRNLVRTNNKDTGRKNKLLKYGNHIVAQLSLLPKTQHDPNSFLVDVSHSSQTLLTFTLSGVFREGDSERGPVRAFSRTMVTVPGGSSMLITNDMLTITSASPDQIQSAFKQPAPTPSSSPVPETAPKNPFEGAGLTEVQQQMVVSFMGDSGMNSEWSAKCLQENGWEYQRAGTVFMELKQQNKIPAEAFIK